MAYEVSGSNQRVSLSLNLIFSNPCSLSKTSSSYGLDLDTVPGVETVGDGLNGLMGDGLMCDGLICDGLIEAT